MTVAAEAMLDITIAVESQDREMTLRVVRPEQDIGIAIERGSSILPEYDGPTEVTPRLYWGQTLATKDKSVLEDIVVKAIPISDVSNPHGGRTVTIG